MIKLKCLIPVYLFSLLLAWGADACACKVLDPDLAVGQYVGGCRDGFAHGYGEVAGPSSYRGDFSHGKKHGKGIKLMPNGDRYEGDFFEDYRHGHGYYAWGDKTPWAGESYEGEYQRDLRHGWGVFQWANGDRYEGAWQEDLRLGPSAMEYRRSLALKGAVKAVKVGSNMCSDSLLGFSRRLKMTAVVEQQVLTQQLQLRLLNVETGTIVYLGQKLKAGDVITDTLFNWWPCMVDHS